MARKLRVEYPGAIYHVMNRGDRREPIFKDDEDGSGEGYLHTACDYVHLNPVRAKLLKPDEALRQYRWSSYGEYLKAPGKRWPWLRVDRLFGEMGIPKDSAAGRVEFERQMEERRAREEATEWKSIRRGWCLGDAEFKAEVLAFGANYDGEEGGESSEEHAERIVCRELHEHGCQEKDLPERSSQRPDRPSDG